MEALPWALLALAVLVIMSFAQKIQNFRDAYTSLKQRIQEEANAHFQAWRQNELESDKQQSRELAKREASVDLQKWKETYESEIRSDAIQRSRSVIIGKVTEHVMPYLPEFRFNPKDARFIGSPIDFIVFDGLDQDSLVNIVFIEVKTNTSTLSKRERQIREAITAGRVKWQELRVERNESLPYVA